MCAKEGCLLGIFPAEVTALLGFRLSVDMLEHSGPLAIRMRYDCGRPVLIYSRLWGLHEEAHQRT